MQNQLRRRRRRLDPGKNMLKQLFCAQKVTSKSSKGREKPQTYLKSRNSARSLHKNVIQAPPQLQKKKTHTHTHTSEELFSHAHTHEAPRPYFIPRLYLNLLFFPPPSLSLTGLYSILGCNSWM